MNRRLCRITLVCTLLLSVSVCGSERPSRDPVVPPWPPLGEASYVFYNGRIITMDDARPFAEAIAISGERVLAVGSDAEILQLSRRGTRSVNLLGKAVMPGFVDPHNHIYNAVFRGTLRWTYGQAEQHMIDVGITTLANANSWPDAARHYLSHANANTPRIRTSIYLGFNDNCGGAWPKDWYLAYPLITDPTAKLRIPGIKIFSDGGSCNRGAFSFYPDDGDLYLNESELALITTELQQIGYQVIIHTLGDVALKHALNGIESALAGGPNTYRHRTEHNRLIPPPLISRYSETGVIPVVFGQPFTCQIIDGGTWSALNDSSSPLALYRSWFDPWRALIDANPDVRVAWKSDAPTNFAIEPMEHLYSLVTRNELRDDGSVCEAPEWLLASAVTVDEALHMMTIDAAHALIMEDTVGSLRRGKYADLIIVSDSPYDVAPEDLARIRVLRTMIGGKLQN